MPESYLDFFRKMQNIEPVNIRKVLNEKEVYDSKTINDASDLIMKLLYWEPEKRLTAKEALRHRFFHN
jgi:serine/threonine protein kinase